MTASNPSNSCLSCSNLSVSWNRILAYFAFELYPSINSGKEILSVNVCFRLHFRRYLANKHAPTYMQEDICGPLCTTAINVINGHDVTCWFELKWYFVVMDAMFLIRKYHIQQVCANNRYFQVLENFLNISQINCLLLKQIDIR